MKNNVFIGVGKQHMQIEEGEEELFIGVYVLPVFIIYFMVLIDFYQLSPICM